jgi:hypothetical protein
MVKIHGPTAEVCVLPKLTVPHMVAALSCDKLYLSYSERGGEWYGHDI